MAADYPELTAARAAARQARWRAMWQSRRWPAWGWWPISRFYGALARVHRWLYASGLRQARHLPCPVLVVGNVIAGGAGKTPTTIALAQHLQARGLRVGIVSRGHGRSESACLEVHPNSSASDVGDEPLLMKRRTGAPVFVAAARAQAGHALLQAHPDTQIILCDDALQHHALAADWRLCVFDERGVGNGWLLPAGPLREPWPRPVDWFIQIHNRYTPLTHPLPGAQLATRQLADAATDASGRQVSLARLGHLSRDHRPVVALAGIAKPEAFFDSLTSLGIVLQQQVPLADHAPMNEHWLQVTFPQGIAAIDDPVDASDTHESNDQRPLLLCTEKDAAKLWDICPQALAVPLHVTLPPAVLAELDAAIDQRLMH